METELRDRRPDVLAAPRSPAIDFFDRVYVVNLPQRTDRRRDVERELRRAAMPLTPGKVEIFQAVRPDSPGGFSSIGASGCFHSHLNLLRQARAQKLRNVLVVEDDLAISGRFVRSAGRLMEQLRHQPWGFCYFGHVLKVPGSGGQVTLERCPPEQGLLTTHFYAINQPVIDRVIEFLEAILRRPTGHPDGGPMHVDGAFSTFRKRNPDVVTLIAQPSLGWQRSSRSDIMGADKWIDRNVMTRGMVQVLRRAKNRLIRH